MAITYEDAVERLNSGEFKTIDSLLALVNEVSGKVPDSTSGSIYLLYSGSTADGSKSSSKLSESVKLSSNGWHWIFMTLMLGV